MAKVGKVSKNARRGEKNELVSRWGGTIIMRSIFKDGRLKHFAECTKTGNTSRRPKELM